MKFSLWKKEQVQNSADYENLVVELPKTGRQVTLSQLVNEADKPEEKKENSDQAAGQDQMANGEHLVDCGGSKMKVNELVEKYNSLVEEQKKNSAPAPAAEKANASDDADKSAETEEKKQHMNSLSGAEEKHVYTQEPAHTIPFDSLSTGRSRYGSK